MLYHAPNHRGHLDITAQMTFGGVALEKYGLVFPRPVALNAWQRIGEQLPGMLAGGLLGGRWAVGVR